MSTATSTKVQERTVKSSSDKATVFLSSKLLKQIDELHLKVEKDTEWSGILIYNVKEGSIDDPKNMVIEAEEVVLMDIGNSTYTEYELDAEKDEYSFDRLTDALLEGKKIGHIHTH